MWPISPAMPLCPVSKSAAADDAKADAGVDVEHGEVVEPAGLAVGLLAQAQGVRLLKQDALDLELRARSRAGEWPSVMGTLGDRTPRWLR